MNAIARLCGRRRKQQRESGGGDNESSTAAWRYHAPEVA
jgi:hypothetical protein